VWYYQLRLVGYMGLSPNLEIEAANTGENQMLDRWAMECIMFLPKPTFAGSPVLFYPLSDLFIGAMIQTSASPRAQRAGQHSTPGILCRR